MQGFPSHLDLSVADPARSIPFYHTLLTALGYSRWRGGGEAWREPQPTRAAWGLRYADGSVFGIDLRPARHNTQRVYDRFEPGPHHLALQADTDAAVDQVHAAMQQAGARITDPPANYGGTPGYGEHYYAVFLRDPDGFKVEVVHARGFEV